MDPSDVDKYFVDLGRYWPFLLIMALGSLVDLFQALYLLKRGLRRYRRRVIEQARRELILEGRLNEKG